jgi:DNA-directed RNA polymerase specialized sigma24 family protein
MPTPEWLAKQFEQHGAYLRAVAYRMLESASEADDAVQESWIRLGRTDVGDVQNLRAWLTTVVARVCLDMLRTRRSRREDSLDTHVPDPVIKRYQGRPSVNVGRALRIRGSFTLSIHDLLDTRRPMILHSPLRLNETHRCSVSA